MAPRTTSKSKAGGKVKSRVSGGHQALDRLNESIEAAEKALKELRAELSRGSRALLKDVDNTLRDARKSVRSIRREVAKELEDLQKAATGKAAGARGATARKPAAKKPAAKKPAAKRSTARKPAARKPAARKTTARASTARKK